MTKDSNDNIEALRACARRKLKAAVYVIGLMLASAEPEKESPRVVGTKYHPRRQVASENEVDAKARRAFKAAVLAIVATHRLDHLRLLKKDPMYAYQYLYRDPVFDWEDQNVPPARPLLSRESSAGVDELVPSGSKQRLQDAVMDLLTMTELSRAVDSNMNIHPRNRRRSLEHLQSVASLLYEDTPAEKERLQDAVMDIMTTVELSHALGQNIHPRNRFHSVAIINALRPWLNDVLQSQEDFRQLHCRLAMKHKLRAAVLAIMAANRMEERAKAARDHKQKFRAAVLAVMAMKRMEHRAEVARANKSGKNKLRAAILAVVALKRLEERTKVARAMQALKRCIGRAKVDRKVRKNLSWLGSSMTAMKHHSPRRMWSGPRPHLDKPLPGHGSSTLDATEHTDMCEFDSLDNPFDVVQLAE